MSIGKIEPFDVDNGNWRAYKERLEQYLIVNQVKPELKIPTFILLIGSRAYELLVDLCSPTDPKSKSYEELVNIFESHVQPKSSEIVERYKFRQRQQYHSESVAAYITALKKSARNCNFKNNLNENLRDQFVCGISSEIIRQALFSQQELTLEKAVEVALNLESAEKNSQLIRTSKTDLKIETVNTSVNAIRFNNTRCNICGKYGHLPVACYFKEFICRKCKKKGHLQRMCLEKNIRQKQNVNYIEGQESNLDTKEAVTYRIDENLENTLAGAGEGTLYWLNKGQCKPMLMKVKIEGIDIVMEVDTGSAITCISEKLYTNMFNKLPIKNTDLVLRYYTGETIKPIGFITPIVNIGVMQKTLQLFIIKGGKTALLGRNWLYDFDIKITFSSKINVNSIQCVNNVFNVNSFINRYVDVFSEGLGRYNGGCVKLHVKPDSKPVFLRARHLPFNIRDKVDAELQLMLKDGIIEPVEFSEWATPIVPIIKSDGRIRICADYKVTLNPLLQVDSFPLPTVDELMSRFPKGEKFTKIDLSQAYLQLCLDEASKLYTVINTHKGLFKFNRLVFGLASSPAIFQRIMYQLFGNLKNVAVFLDDILISGKNDTEHLETLFNVFDKLKEYGFKVNKSKCLFFQNEVEYLGYIISGTGLKTNKSKVESVLKMNPPRDISELRSFLGTINYYGKFIQGLSSVLSPMYELLKLGTKWHWSQSCQMSFNNVKELLSVAPILMHYDVNLPVILTCDASAHGLGAILSHKLATGEERPVAYASRSLNCAEKHYSQIDKEALGIIFGVKKFHQFLYGKRFLLRTDHKPLLSIFGPKKGIPLMAASRLQRWSVILSAYYYDIEYVCSTKNTADILSRLPVGEVEKEVENISYLYFIEENLPITSQVVKSESDKDPILSRVINYVYNGWPNVIEEEELKHFFQRKEQLYVESGCLMWGYKIVIPLKLRKKILDELHKTHLGIVKTKSLARSYVWWPGLDNDIENICHNCVTCICENAAPPKSPPQSWQIPSQPWQRLHVDLLGPIEGHTFLVIVDVTSKWIEIFKLNKSNAATVINRLRETFSRFGLPRQLVSDNGPPFSSNEFEYFMQQNGIKHTFSAVYHPASNGAAESAVKICKQAIKKAIRDQLNVDVALQRFLLDYRNVSHSSTGESPACILQGRRLRTRLDLLRPNFLDKIERKQEERYQRTVGVERVFEVGDKVWVRDYTSGSDPYVLGEILERVSSRNYLVKANGRELSRHVDQLKKSYNSTNSNTDNDPMFNKHTGDSNIVSSILAGNCNSSRLGTTSPPSPQAVVTPLVDVVSQAHVTEPPPLRRSCRTIRPPNRYGFN